ncbi:hypothetical protein BASA50_004978 [Batrachochytrium salamandrivorans]|uniref:DUF155 domain-containing protein n=1 Tax=Batrachochytrium salamandrivorans TaxID=1357716 RepID=A0ABQ8FFB8_9FUNG|nr:hypothetical protein BASA60_000519 [Batrachochytrium salamandrivorans]KAH6596647.1 hypothetical protein BASA50_004978 [Batrachochytrium salamandrivorans]KAH9270444.1 hypothetical protein BASA83_007444 [Batrachochytrium salamandrivorans]
MTMDFQPKDAAGLLARQLHTRRQVLIANPCFRVTAITAPSTSQTAFNWPISLKLASAHGIHTTAVDEPLSAAGPKSPIASSAMPIQQESQTVAATMQTPNTQNNSRQDQSSGDRTHSPPLDQRITASSAPEECQIRRATLAKKKRGVRDVRSDDEPPSGPFRMISAPAPDPLRVTAFSTAEKYNTSSLFRMLKKHYQVLPYMADDIFHIRLSENESEEATQGIDHRDGRSRHANTQTSEGVTVTILEPEQAEAFFFSSGTFVTWGATDEQNELILKRVRGSEINMYSSVETEWFDYFYDTNQQGGMVSDTIILGDEHPLDQSKLAYSAGLTRSVKLASLETLLEEHLDKNRGIPEILLRGKRIPVGRAAILRNLGELFSLRAHVNLNSELLDNPDFCWSSRHMEEHFDRISHSLDVRPRIAVFNKKLDYANEVAEALRNHLHEQHSLKLEWCIIILISVEIAFECAHFVSRAM